MVHRVFAQAPLGPALKKMFKKTPKADNYFDPEAQNFEEEETAFLNAELIPGESDEAEL